jgi:ABC-2 type transport system ATP-binding protein
VTDAVIEVHDVVKRFRIPRVRRDTVREHVLAMFRRRAFDDLAVLDGASLRVARGETVAIMGRNGSGKSTLLKLIAGIYVPDSGRIVVRAPLTAILELGVGWNPELDAVDNVYLIGGVMGLGRREIAARLDGILAFAELERFAKLPVKHYSTGMAARLAYAVAFSAVRNVLVLDEIFAVGDAGFRARCEERYQELARAGHTVVLVSHDPRTVATFCARGYLLEQGRVLAAGPGEDIARAYVDLVKTGGP